MDKSSSRWTKASLIATPGRRRKGGLLRGVPRTGFPARARRKDRPAARFAGCVAGVSPVRPESPRNRDSNSVSRVFKGLPRGKFVRRSHAAATRDGDIPAAFCGFSKHCRQEKFPLRRLALHRRQLALPDDAPLITTARTPGASASWMNSPAAFGPT
jgi:hypothetical protein